MAGALHGVLASLKAAAASATDTFFRYVSLLLNTTNTNGAQNNTFLDSSTNAFSIIRNGNTTQGNFSPFSQTGWSNYFDGTGDYLAAPDNAAFDLGSSSFTVECWFYPNSVSASFGLLSRYAFSGVASGWVLNVPNSTTLRFVRGNDVLLDATITALVTGQWYHAAAVRNGSTLTLYLNGTQVAQATGIANFADAATTVQIGRTHTVTNDLNGYISNTRIVKGTAVYTSNFTPPTTPLTNITNTSLLTCQSNRFIDNSSNAFAITRNGDVSVQAFSPFAPTAAWSASTNGGSGYFDGAGDYLEVADNTAFDLGSGDFTVEAFVYLSSLPASNARYNIFGQWGPNPGANDLSYIGQLFNDAGTMKITLDWSTTGTTTTGVAITASIVATTWLHIAWVRSGTSLKIFLNGTEVTSGNTITGTLWNSSRPLNIGRNEAGNSNLLNGYLSNLRIVKGTAVYTANFTPPTAPLTAITNTSLLLNFTNAGIYDSASGNDLETVGNAQVSTVQAKWGTTSMAFDGTGDWLIAPDRLPLRFGTGAFTVEGWIYFDGTGSRGIVSKGGTLTGWVLRLTNTPFIAFTFGDGSVDTSISSSVLLTANTWYHVAVVREGTGTNQTKLYVNGVNDGTGTCSINFNQTNSLYIGSNRGTSNPYTGYIDDLRITNGYARYTANFTPPTAAFPLN